MIIRVRSLLDAARREAGAVAALFVLAFGAWAFLGLADEVGEGGTHGFDLAVLDALRVAGMPDHPIGPAWLKLAAADFTAVGSITVLAAIVLGVTGLFAAVRKPQGALMLLVASGGGVAISQALKVLFGRERPPLIYHAVEAANPSFPSGHAMLSAVVFLTLGALAARLTKDRPAKVYIVGLAVALTLLVGMTRIYLGVHWTSDVLAGWCVGAAWATACWLAAWLWGRRSKSPQSAHPGEGRDPDSSTNC
ncbi:MAG: phosphatase PAP2 family protein [Caulobacteraceae bacterium]